MPNLLLLLIGGIAAGSYASSVGGGALLAFPLLLLLGFSPHIAIATQRFSAVILELVSGFTFYHHGHLKQNQILHALIFGAIAAVGGLIGSHFLTIISEKDLNVIVGIFLAVATLIIFFKKTLGTIEKPICHGEMIFGTIAIFGLGIYGGFFGAGFGSFVIIVLMMMGFSAIQGAALSKIIGFLLSGVTTIIFARQGLIDYAAGLSLGLGYAIGGWFGIKVSLKKGNLYVRSALIAAMLLTLLKLLMSS